MEESCLTSDLTSGVLTFRVTGEIDHHGAKFLREKMDEQIYYERPGKIVIDLSDISFMDSSGLGLLLGRYTKARDLGAAFSLRNPTAEIMRILALAGADKLLTVERSDKSGVSDRAQSGKASVQGMCGAPKASGKVRFGNGMKDNKDMKVAIKESEEKGRENNEK